MLNNRARLPFDEKPASSQREAKQPSNVNAFDPMKDLFEYFRPKRLYTIDKLMEDRCAHEKITKIKSNMMTEVKKVNYFTTTILKEPTYSYPLGVIHY